MKKTTLEGWILFACPYYTMNVNDGYEAYKEITAAHFKSDRCYCRKLLTQAGKLANVSREIAALFKMAYL